MKKSFLRFMLIVLMVSLAFTLGACRRNGDDNGDDNGNGNGPGNGDNGNGGPTLPDEEFSLAGVYAVDITNMGMALTFYLRIDEDRNFILSPSREFSQDRGSGTIGELAGTYLMIYHDSTPEQSKTATFEREGHNLIFRSTLPYGASNIRFEAEDEDDPSIIYNLYADKYVYEEYYDTYLGMHTEGGVDYEYILTLKAGARYHYVSRYLEGEELVEYKETGTFRVHEDIIGMMPKGGTEVFGSITSDAGLEVPVKMTAASERNEYLLRVATSAQYAGTLYAYVSGTGYESYATLELDYFSGYVFTSDYGDGTFVETGTFEVAGTTYTFTPEGKDPVVGTKANYKITVAFDVSETVNDVSFVFYDELVQGFFDGFTMVEEAYYATLTLNPDGTYALLIVDEDNDDEVLIEETGTFSVNPGMMAFEITLTSTTSNTSIGAIWTTGLNMSFEINGTNFSFLLTK